MAEPRDYLAYSVVGEKDKLDYGVKGQRWGVRRSRAQLKAASGKKSDKAKSESEKSSSGAPKSADSERYDKLTAQIKSGSGKNLSESDLKFYNARTDALKKIESLNQSKPGWIGKTGQKVIQTSAERSMQSVSDAVANKYITQPLVTAISKSGPNKPSDEKKKD